MLSFRYHGTNCYFLETAGDRKLVAVDAGWPCTLFEYARMMKTLGRHLEEIGWAMVTHFHMDHAGLVAEFLERGITCLVFETQLGAIEAMEKTIRKNHKDYTPMDQGKLKQVRAREAAGFFAQVGLKAQVVITDYHSQDSVSLVTDEREAIIGDLPPQGQMMPADRRFEDTWRTVWNAGGRVAYPSHAAAFQITDPG